MVRSSSARMRWPRCFPHMRGDGPFLVRCIAQGVGFSPHAWGWSAFFEDTAQALVVFPTCVGHV